MPGIKKAATAPKSRKRKLVLKSEEEEAPQAGPSSSTKGVATKKLCRSTSTDGDDKKKVTKFVEHSEGSGNEDSDFEKQTSKKKKTNGRSSLALNKRKNGADRCATCRQFLHSDNLRLYEGHPENAVEEFIALTDPRLSLFTGDEESVNEEDQRPTHKLTAFSVYDTDGHLCAFDSGLIETNMLLYFSGYIKPIFDENPDIEGGVPTKDMGPINEWWVSGFDGGDEALLGFSTCFADYYLMQASSSYMPFMNEVRLKSFMSKAVIEFLLENHEVEHSYEDLLNHLQSMVPPAGIPRLDEEALLRNAQFVCEQVQSINENGDEDDPHLIVLTAMKELINLAGVSFTKQAKKVHVHESRPVTKKATWSKATTTPLVQAIFENMFEGQLDQDTKGPRRQRCSMCEACQRPDCGSCSACLNMTKFGGSGKSKQACNLRRCPNMAVQEANDSDADQDDDDEKETVPEVAMKFANPPPRTFTWGKCRMTLDSHKIYEKCRLVQANDQSIDMEISPGDFVMLLAANPTQPRIIARVNYLLQDLKTDEKICHAQIFIRASNTVLGETACRNEILQLEECHYISVFSIDRKLEVNKVDIPENWASLGGTTESSITPFSDAEDSIYWYQKAYIKSLGRFVDLPAEPANEELMTECRYCGCCERKFVKQPKHKHLLDPLQTTGSNNEVLYSGVMWKGQVLRPGSCVFIDTEAYPMKVFSDTKPVIDKIEKVDETKYPEHYRKNSSVSGSNEKTPEPFHIARIISIFKHKKSQKILLTVAKFYRPENTQRVGGTRQLDLNLLYWSSEECTVDFDLVEGQCWVLCSDNLTTSSFDWTQGGPHRFYFTQAYDNNSIVEPPEEAVQFGVDAKSSKGKGKGKSKGKSESAETSSSSANKDGPPSWPQISHPLRCLDVFAGCGGLSEGMHQSGAAVSAWAVEKEESAANAFKLNNPTCQVFSEDCNELLKLVMQGTKTLKGQKLPLKGAVEMICGGPPCQGFSGMNRFNSRQYSIFKNSLIVSLLSYCDYYRPKVFVLENVRNFVAFKQSMVLKLALRCLHAMGYQCAFGVLQAGNYGVPQTRRRAIIIAAAPGEILPDFPEPTHVFNPKACQLSIVVNNKKYSSGCKWNAGAPLRTVTVRDAMSDLPDLRNGASQMEMAYGSEPQSYVQKLARRDSTVLRDHICKEMSALVEARMSHIPLTPGADWRDLPNIEMRLADGRTTNKLIYTHKLNKGMRGVCPCAQGKACDPTCRQDNTLIPWCLPHTGNKYNHWAGLYGRVDWDGFFSTTVTNPEPMAKQGRVLHPEQTRVVSVRECARSQGFPDHYRFYGNIMEKHRQIGNAVPPPLAAAIGREIRRCVSIKEKQDFKQELHTTP